MKLLFWQKLQPLVEVALALLLGILVGAVLMAIWGYHPWKAYLALLQGSFGNYYSIANTFSRASPLILTGLTFAIGLRAGLFNIGAQGQMIIGAVVAVAVGTLSLPPILHLIIAISLAMLAGAMWSLPVAWLKLKRHIHEVISTIMLNWIAFWLVMYLIINLLSDPLRGERSVVAAVNSRFPLIIIGSDLTYAIFAAVGVAIIIYWVLWYMVPGFELRCSGLNTEAARYAGMNPNRSITLALILGGLAAGLAGATQILGRYPYALDNGLGNLANLGFDGIAVALVGRNHPLGVVVAAIFFGAMAAGAGLMGFRAGVPLDMIRVVQGTIVLTVAAPELWRIVYQKIQLLRGEG